MMEMQETINVLKQKLNQLDQKASTMTNPVS